MKAHSLRSITIWENFGNETVNLEWEHISLHLQGFDMWTIIATETNKNLVYGSYILNVNIKSTAF